MSRSPLPDALRVDTTARHGNAPDRSSMSPSLSLMSMPAVNPDPAYIAAAAAANVVTSEIINEYHISFPQDQEHDGASVTPGSLNLINAFLDRLLFNFLSCAHSTSLASLRPAVTEVLRPRLAKEAIGGADEELQEYLGGDIEELNTFHGGEEPTGDWDLDLVWKRTRLRCMLYTRLGDMEEEDEEMYLEQENLNGDNRSSQREGGMVSPAVAIFLTSVLEFVGEHALMVAAQAAYKRHETRARIEESGLQRVIVEETDMEKVALNSTLGRLWRSWRASVRSPRGSVSKIPGVGSRGFRGFSVGSRSSIGTSERDVPDDNDRVPSVAEVLDGADPSSIPLPSTDNDIAEIEVPGYSAKLAQRQRRALDQQGRPISMFVRTDIDRASKVSNQLETVASEDESTPRQENVTKRRPRARSLPTPETPFFAANEYPEPETPQEQPREEVGSGQELRDPGRSIIDMAGNSAQVFGDYAIPKSSSAPTSPFHGSDFNATSHIANEYITHPRTSYIESEHDPADGLLHLTRDDYKIDASEHAVSSDQALPKIPILASQLTRDLRPSFNEKLAQPPVSPLIDQTPGSGRVSPVGHASIRSGEVSPIEPSDDESDIFIQPTPVEDIPDVPRKETPPPDPISKEVPTAPKQVVAQGSTLQKPQGQRSWPTEGTKRKIEPVIPESSSRGMQGRHRAKAGPTEVDYTKEENREAFVIPEGFNVNNQFPDASSLSRRPLPPDSDTNNRKYRSATAESTTLGTLGALPSVQENKPKVSETLEKPIPPAPSPNQFTRKAVPPNASPNSAARAEQRRQVPAAAAAAAATAERVPVQRATAQNIVTRDIPRISESASRDVVRSEKPPVAATSKSLATSEQQPREFVTSRTSSDLNRNFSVDEKHGRSSTSNPPQQKDFDQLINSGETLQYTLTPQNMRDIEEGDSPIQQKPAAPAPIQVRSRGASVADRSPKQLARSSGLSPASMNGLKSHPVANNSVSSKSTEDSQAFVIRSGPAVKRGPQLVAKDARMESTNTSDLKDFFRSTGPDTLDPRTAQQANRGPTKVATVSNPPTIAPPIVSPRVSTASTRSKLKPKFEPREPTRQGNDTSMLAEFFRSGGPAGAHRVPDTDDITVRPKDALSIASTQDSFIARSIQSSTNSRTGLLDSSRNAGKMSAWEKRGMPASSDDAMPPIQKTRRPPRDPYALDSDDEDEDDLVQTPRGAKIQDNEESLLDFLRSEPPPGANTTPPPLDVGNAPSKTLQRKPSGPSMRQRFTLSGSKSGSKNLGSKRGPVSPNNLLPRTNPSSLSTAPAVNDPRPYSKPSNGTGPVFETSPQIRPRQTSLGATGAPTGRMNNVRAARKQARDSRDNTDSVRDLAKFLRETGPPPSMTQAPSQTTPPKEEGGFSRMFSRRKKSAQVS